MDLTDEQRAVLETKNYCTVGTADGSNASHTVLVHTPLVWAEHYSSLI